MSVIFRQFIFGITRKYSHILSTGVKDNTFGYKKKFSWIKLKKKIFKKLET